MVRVTTNAAISFQLRYWGTRWFRWKSEKESGTVEKGKHGDLILVSGNPLDDIRQLRNVEYVVTNGAMFRAAELWQSVGFKP